MRVSDITIIGAGIIGLTIGREILLNYPKLNVLILDKEDEVARHASGRNSGVLHAGFYYSPDSLKAQLTRTGNALLHSFLEERSIPVRKTGKVVVTTSADQLSSLDELHRRGQANGVDLHVIDSKQLAELEPLAQTVERALWSPTTSVTDPIRATQEIARAFEELGGVIQFGTEVTGLNGGEIQTTTGVISSGHVVNAAGLYADVWAKYAGVNDDYVMMPFKGLYWYAPKLNGQLSRHIYPVPDIENPFLGVHYTVTVNGDVKVGPTAIPSLWREDYGGLSNFRGSEAARIMGQYPRFLTSRHHNVPRLIRSEVPKYSKSYLVKQAMPLAPSLSPEHFTLKGKPGVRAQLLDKKTGKLEMDFVLRTANKSTHVLNAVSPAFTSSLAVSQYVIEHMKTNNVF